MAFAGAAALERGHDLDEVFEPYLRPASGVRASSSECSFERPGAEHRQRKGSYLASAGKRRQAQVSDRRRPLDSRVNAALSIVQSRDTGGS